MHARTPEGLIDYVAFFERVARLPQQALRVEIHNELVIAVNKIEVEGNLIKLRFASGNPEELPLLYDERTGDLETASTPDGTWLAAATRVVLVPSERLIIIESKRVGVSATSLERYFTKLARQNRIVNRLNFDISPLPSSSFEDELERYARIREAIIQVNRPNSDWDDANDILSELAAESGGQKASVSVSAARGDSLEKNEGIVNIIRDHVRRGYANIRDVRIFGRRIGDVADSMLTLEKHQEQRAIEIETRIAQDLEEEIVMAAEVELAERAILLVRERSQAPEGDR
ncbi:hypothetical protein ABZS66_44880 [Dactylosporangium sp. NPDC005572]|uniref:hypothetical protein n=1 Tax=Dactylosporangium sp. NPDC005572 TaxID=3156889 RepID=UPI0033A588AE